MDQLNQDEVDVKRSDAEERKQMNEDHDNYKKEMQMAIFNLKDELDTLLQNPNMIA